MDKKELKLKKGDRVWAKVPVNATIIRVNKEFGYTLKTDDGMESCYYGDDEVQKVSK